MTVLPFRRRDDDGPVSDHWLLFNAAREVTGCHCGFAADMDSDCGWGDSVVDHLLSTGRPQNAPTALPNVGTARENEASPQGAPTPAGSDRQPVPGRG